MSLRLGLVNLYYRHVERRALSRAAGPEAIRARMRRQGDGFLHEPPGTHANPCRIPTPDGPLEGCWISHGRARRDKVILMLHGGAYMFGGIPSYRGLAGAVSKRTGARVLLPDYRLAPEHPFPAAIEDAVASYRHLLDIGHAPEDIALLGDSAGGGLVLALLHVVGTDLPYPAAAVTFSPWCDLTLAGESLSRNARREALLPVERIEEARAFYLGEAAPDDPRASPLFGSFEGAPPVLIQASCAEVLEDDARRMAATLADAGVDVETQFWQRTPHVWQLLQGRLPEADVALDQAAAFLRDHLGLETDGTTG
ncbi:alpha/beta hydrolase [Roseobacter sp. HKCCA0434]|uniref:alpha/beta hydrolase n=1 Tax=Roseobacter sp. HKCCA0434 TaxID=3079297 RepID=UPI002905F083|nr:alpha/beta hydrolase [Roseobacter sp. HKCCA0434]